MSAEQRMNEALGVISAVITELRVVNAATDHEARLTKAHDALVLVRDDLGPLLADPQRLNRLALRLYVMIQDAQRLSESVSQYQWARSTADSALQEFKA